MANTTGGRWITVNGTHIFIKDGQTVGDAFKETTGKVLSKSNSSTKKTKTASEIIADYKDSKGHVDLGGVIKEVNKIKTGEKEYTYKEAKKAGFEENLGSNKELKYKGQTIGSGEGSSKYITYMYAKKIKADSLRDMAKKIDIVKKAADVNNSRWK